MNCQQHLEFLFTDQHIAPSGSVSIMSLFPKLSWNFYLVLNLYTAFLLYSNIEGGLQEQQQQKTMCVREDN